MYVSARNHVLGVYSCMQMCLNVYSYMQITWVKQKLILLLQLLCRFIYISIHKYEMYSIFMKILLQICKMIKFFVIVFIVFKLEIGFGFRGFPLKMKASVNKKNLKILKLFLSVKGLFWKTNVLFKVFKYDCITKLLEKFFSLLEYRTFKVKLICHLWKFCAFYKPLEKGM